MKKIFLFSIILILYFHTLYSQWIWQQVNPTYYYYDIQFVNKNTGYVCGSNSTIVKTTDGGQTWFDISVALSSQKNLMGIAMLNESTGYIAGWAETIIKTTNGGINWIILKDANYLNGSFNDISFINVNTGWVCGTLGNIQKTTDGGLTWDSITVWNGYPMFRNIQFFDQNKGYACSDGAVYTWKSTDGGFNWFKQYLQDSAISSWANMYMMNKDTGWVVGETNNNNRLYRTLNGGNNWIYMCTIIGPQTFAVYSITFLNFNLGWMGGSVGMIYRTTSGGLNWIDENANSPGFVANFSIYKDSLIWATGGHGAIGYKNIFIGLRKISENIPVNFTLYQNYPNPFNSETTIKFDIPKSGVYKIAIYDVIGREVDIIFNQFFKPGNYAYNYNAEKLSSGVYFYKLYSDKFSGTNKFILLK
jgi:photosystem II stability/assembly factor-like uncharacterized protein